MTAISTVGAAQRHEFFTPEAGAAATAMAGLHFQPRFVDEFHGLDENPGSAGVIRDSDWARARYQLVRAGR